MKAGSLTINGITDAELVTILQVKAKFPSMSFNPHSLQPLMQAAPNNNQQKQTGYNNAVISWVNHDGLSGALEILQALAPKAAASSQAA
jgi:hypothetical protein